MRHVIFDVEKIKAMLKEIKQVYGGISISILKQANIEHPEKYPSYKTVERKLGALKNIKKDIENY